MTDANTNAIRPCNFSLVLCWSSRVLFFAGCICAGVAMWSWTSSPAQPPPGPWLSVEPMTIDVGTMPQGISRLVRFEVSNRNPRQPVIIFGATESCGPQGCIDGSNIPVTVPPGGKATLQFMFRAGSDPVFEYDLTIYSDAPAQIETNVKIVGETLPYTGPEFY